MARSWKPKVITANHLLEGDVIYYRGDGTWSRDLNEAIVAGSEEQGETLLVEASSRPEEVVGPYLADVELQDDGVILPTHFREAFRTRGPSNYFHGKQAEV